MLNGDLSNGVWAIKVNGHRNKHNINNFFIFCIFSHKVTHLI